ncbi:hypothetical protein CMI44_02100 [Candidatus Pacearchaeota archaeon]|nr:hypothetical protein [Candidatus Pacearchaeota archaeon]|tara:strand:+ start:1440 stop:2000 length:561 start_codon:yes stop_codon:yes gene_type:complete
MKFLTKSDILKNKEFYINEIKSGKIFVYPTDTIYGIGCIATNSSSAAKIRQLKKRDKKPFSIIVPSKKWVHENCNAINEEHLQKLPGRYTLLFELKNKNSVAKKELLLSTNLIGVRIPSHWFAQLLSEANSTFVTTSANYSGEPPIKKVSELPDSIKKNVDYIIDEGILNNFPSTVINTLTGEILR